jgi:uncharacterized damage-inducible protein DinB
MTKAFRSGAVGALLDEYEKVIIELQQIIEDISGETLIKVADENTTDENCISIQAILAHVIRSGYAYAVYIRNLKGEKMERPISLIHTSIGNYQNELDEVFRFTVDTFSNIQDHQLEESDNNKKIISSWGQLYDIEQIMEHAIVHILRHRRQIEKFKIALALHD